MSASSEPFAALAARGLAAAYAGREIWSGAEFTIPSGSFTAVIGPNGAGKSTLFRLILGLSEPSSGSIEVFGAPPQKGNPRIGYVPQGTAREAEVAVRGVDLVALGVDGHRWGLPILSRSAALRQAWEAVRAVGAEAYADRPLSELSGGEQQRLYLAQALAGNPRLLLLDEPLSHLDVRQQGAMVRLISSLSSALRLTVLLIAHDVNPLMEHVGSVVYIAQGHVACGAPRENITSGSLSQIYGAPIEVLTDSRGRLFVAGLEEEARHPH